MEKITLEQLKNEVLKLADASPTNHYIWERGQNSCWYVSGSCTNGSVGCIFGQALIKLGVPKERLQAREGDSIGTVLKILKIVDAVPPSHPFNIAQQIQDQGRDWAEAVLPIRLFEPIPS